MSDMNNNPQEDELNTDPTTMTFRIRPKSTTTSSPRSPTSPSTSSDLTTKTIPRLTKEYRQLLKNPIDGVVAVPQPTNLLNWYFVIDGPDLDCVKRGKYFGRLVLSIDYPFSPPSVFMDTPSYLFSINEHVCMTNTAYHSSDWTPQWSIGSLLTSLRMFFIVRFNEKVKLLMKSESIATEAIVNHYTNASLYTTYRIAEFRQMFPQLAQEFKYQLQQQSYQFFQSNNNSKLLPNTIKLPLPTPTPPQSTQITNINSITIPIIPKSTIEKDKGQSAFSATSSRTDTPTMSLSALEDFSESEQIYIRHLLNQLPLTAKYQLWYLERNWVLFFTFVAFFVILSILSMIGYWD